MKFCLLLALFYKLDAFYSKIAILSQICVHFPLYIVNCTQFCDKLAFLPLKASCLFYKPLRGVLKISLYKCYIYN